LATSQTVSETEDLETVPNEWGDITLESTPDRISYGDGTNVIIDSPGTVTILHNLDDTETEESSIEEVYLDSLEQEDKVILSDIRSNSIKSRVALSREDMRNLWTVSIGSEEYNILFPAGACLSSIDGLLVNLGSNNITGVVIDDSLSDSTYFNKTFTVLPFTSSNAQTSVFRYGARSYLTDYYTSSTGTLQTSVSYTNAIVLDRPVGWSLSPADLVICGLLLFSVLVSILGGLIRR